MEKEPVPIPIAISDSTLVIVAGQRSTSHSTQPSASQTPTQDPTRPLRFSPPSFFTFYKIRARLKNSGRKSIGSAHGEKRSQQSASTK